MPNVFDQIYAMCGNAIFDPSIWPSSDITAQNDSIISITQNLQEGIWAYMHPFILTNETEKSIQIIIWRFHIQKPMHWNKTADRLKRGIEHDVVSHRPQVLLYKGMMLYFTRLSLVTQGNSYLQKTKDSAMKN